MAAALLALLASFMWGTCDFGNSFLSRRSSSWAVMLVMTTSMAAALLVTVVVLQRPAPSASILAIPMLGGVLIATSGFAYFGSMRITKMSVTSPIVAGAAAVPVLWGLARGEHPHPLQLIGIVAILGGIVVISLPGANARDDEMPVTLPGILLAVTASVCMGLMVVALSYGAASDPVWAVAGLRWAAAVWVGLWVAAVRPKMRLQRRLVLPGIAFSLTGLGGNLVLAKAMTLADLSVVSVLGWLGSVVVILWASLFLGERLRPVQWVAAAAVLTGVVLVTVA